MKTPLLSLNTLLAIFYLLSAAFAPPTNAATFTAETLIQENDSTYDGQDIMIDGTTVTINGRHSFNSLELKNGAVLTHSPGTPTETFRFDLQVIGQAAIGASSRIDVSGKGYLPGRTLGNVEHGIRLWVFGAAMAGADTTLLTPHTETQPTRTNWAGPLRCCCGNPRPVSGAYGSCRALVSVARC